ncbi:response regulator [Legionella hackeliae]|uniref:Putative Response regulator receiver n=1 Tax=Legionella hackeliae TaxID=449 RepID=A0A0A8UTR8_LEGHA|nr:response regulator [Legionella hackeliae]KTD12681.1 two component sensor and regulator histidine kinase response regulator [Legionella hackeliae]CEK12098.1 Putative Response regulator receiver [Legionella hackeliae]STX48886.1 two component sensor and regulator, histidine kinase response regulator [Legionella hackeliae]
MRVLIVEDNAFNAFCLTRLLTTVNKQIQATVVGDSLSALNYLAENEVAFVIMDGDLGATDGLYCNGPALVETIWQQNSQLPVVAWSDSESMRKAFADVFKQYNKTLNDYTCWTKIVSHERIRQSLPYLLAQNFENYLSVKQKKQEHCLPAA